MQAALISLTANVASAVKIGDTIPKDLTLDFGFPPEKINLKKRVKGKNVIVLGLPGGMFSVFTWIFLF